jgi:hypothetical protein
MQDDDYEDKRQTKLDDIRGYIQHCGFDTIFDVLNAELQEFKVHQLQHVSRRERELQKWLHGDGPSAILSLYVEHSKLELSTSVKNSVTQLFIRILSQEVSNILEEKSLQRHLQDYKLDTDFSFDTMASTFAASMPSLSTTLYTVFTSDSNENTTAESASKTPETMNDPLVLLVNAQTSTSKRLDLPIQSTTSESSQHQIRGRNFMVNTALAILCYAKSARINLFQGHIGYFLYASKTPKRVIEPLHQLGLSITYESIIMATKAMARDSLEQLQKWKFHIPATFAVFDNLNYYSRVHDQRIHNQPELLNLTACYVAYNPKTRLNRQLLNSDIQLQKLGDLTSFGIMPTISMKTRWEGAARASINTTLFRYLRPAMIKYRKRGEPLIP